MNRNDWNMNLANLLLVIGLVDLLDTRWNQPLYRGIDVTQKTVENKHFLWSRPDEEVEIGI